MSEYRPRRKRTEEERFFKKVRQDGPNPVADCWIWTGAKNKLGHGSFSRTHAHGQPAAGIVSHRWSWEFFNGPIPKGLQMDHLCRNASCVNPWHLDPVTPRVNTLRGMAPSTLLARANRCKQGHEFTPENTEIQRLKNGRQLRTCRTCHNASRRRLHAERRGGEMGHKRCDQCGRFCSRVYLVMCNPLEGGFDRAVCERCAEMVGASRVVAA